MPRIEELFSSLTGGKSFTKLDLSHAYLQVELEEASKEYVTTNTHKRLYRYNRLPFGVASAPVIFQRVMENLLQGFPNVCMYIDDILVTGENDLDHLQNLNTVLGCLKNAGIHLKQEKCKFMLSEVQYLGHTISAEGLKPSKSKVKAIEEAPVPRNVSELKSFLGLVNYYAKFLPNLASTLAPLYLLLNKNTKWSWSKEHNATFQSIKSALKSTSLLVHFDSSLPIVLSCDASPYGVGAVLSHKISNTEEKPIAFASRSLATAEKNYSQLDKEALAVLFGVKKFHTYLYGRKFLIQTDHKPLTQLLGDSKAIPALASPRLQRWALTLGGYDYTIQYRKGVEQCHADALSRLLLPQKPSSVPVPEETVLLMEHLAFTPISATQVKVWTDQDPILSKIKQQLLAGSPIDGGEETEPFKQRQTELSIEDGCILWGSRVVLPPRARDKMLTELHNGHPGIAKMKNLARCYVWWPKMDAALEQQVRQCVVCQNSRKMPPCGPLHPWEWPDKPPYRLRWTLYEPYAASNHRCLFKMARSVYHRYINVRSYNSETWRCFFQVWPSRINCFR